MRLFETCVLSLPLWQFKLALVTALTRCALGLGCGAAAPAEGTEIHPTLAAWPWAAIMGAWLSHQPEPRFSQGKPVHPCHLVSAERGWTWLCAHSPTSSACRSPWSRPNPMAAAAHSSKRLAEVPLRSHSESKLGNWMKLAQRLLCGPFFML